MGRRKVRTSGRIEKSSTPAPQVLETEGRGQTLPLLVAFFFGVLAAYMPALIVGARERVALFHRCNLGEICREGQERPFLQDGSPSHRVWDRPRYLMKTEFREALRHVRFPGANVSFLSKEPLVVFFDNVLADDEIDFLVEKATPRFTRSRVVGPDGVLVDDPRRTSDTAWLSAREHPKFLEIKERVANLVGFHGEQGEDISVNRYRSIRGGQGQFYGAHRDYIPEDVAKGGETAFFRDGRNRDFDESIPAHIKVTPRRGRVLAWFNCHPHTEKVDRTTLHAGLPVDEGEKLAATFFMRNCTLYEDQVVRLVKDSLVSHDSQWGHAFDGT